jgi:uncharacterized membrane protein
MVVLRRAFTGAAIAWPLMIAAAPFAASRHESTAAWYAFAVLVYGIGSFVCHQLPARSFHLWAAQLPVCARCTGIYVGGAGAALVAATRRAPGAGDEMAPRAARTLLVLGALPTAATLAFEWASGQTPSNLTRAFAGLPLGAAVAWIVCKVN